MIPAKPSKLARLIFTPYLRSILKKDFQDIVIIGDSPSIKGSVLLLMNHHSWWDGFFAFWLNQKVLKKRFHILMLEEQLRRYAFFNKLGAIGIDKNNPRSIGKSLLYIREMLASKDNLVNFYPQGEIKPSFESIRAERGIERIANAADSIVLAHTFIEYSSERKATVYIGMKEITDTNLSTNELEQQWADLIDDCEKKIISKEKGKSILRGSD